MTMTTYTKNKILNHQFGKTAYTAAATLYVGLCTSVSAGGVVTGEPSGNGYARVAITNSTDYFTTSTTGSLSNKAAVTFPACTTTRWGTLATIFVSDAASGDTNTLHYQALAVPKTVEVGDAPSIAIGALVFTQG